MGGGIKLSFEYNTDYETPDFYEKDLLHAMVRDAHSLFVYWEISHRKKWLISQHFQCDWNEMPRILRIYDVTNIDFHGRNAHSYFDLNTPRERTNSYIYDIQSNTAYIVDYGTYSIENQFIPLLRSNTVLTSRDTKASSGEALISVVSNKTEVSDHHRIKPQHFENFQPILSK